MLSVSSLNCLGAKAILLPEITLEEFLAQAIEPPKSEIAELTIEDLQKPGALTETEQLTSLGKSLSLFTLQPLFVKMILHEVLFRCLDAILIIVTTLNSPGVDFFRLQSTKDTRQSSNTIQNAPSAGTSNNLMALLNVFQMARVLHGKSQMAELHNFLDTIKLHLELTSH